MLGAATRDRAFGALRRAVEEGLVDPRMALLPTGQTLLRITSCVGGGVSLLRYLILEKGLDPNEVKEDDGATPLHTACIDCKEDSALFFINEVPACNIDARMKDGSSPLTIAAAKGLL